MPESFLHYDIETKLGEGGMGVVFLASDTKLKRKVALKFLPRQVSLNAIERKRFEQEAQAAASLNHPNIAQVYAIEEKDDKQFIVMEYVEGMNLKEAIEQGKLTLEEKTKIASQIAEGIKAAHDKGIIHRDIKSTNIMFDRASRVKIMDFGLARMLDTDHITKTGTTVGTTAYMSPEQLAGHEADVRSDIWSYGVVLYELFSGELPFKGKYEQAVMYAITEEQHVPISQIAPDVPERIVHVINRCLEKNHKKRYLDFSDILDDLNEKKPLKGRRTRIGAYLYTGIFAILALGALALFSKYNISLMADTLPEKKYLAVLPFENIGGDPGLQAICDGLAETFSYKLSELEKFEDSYWVAPAREMRNENITTVRQANEKFGVNLAILSSIQTVGDSTRLILELVDADHVRRLNTKEIVVPAQNLSLLEQNSIKAMLSMLKIEINSRIDEAIKEGEPSEPAAYEYYLKGLASMQGTSMDSLNNAISYFNKAIEIDPEFALGYAGKGESYWRMFNTSGDVNFVKQSDQALKRALGLNKELAPVQSLLGMVKAGTGDYEMAISHYSKALEIDPKYSPAYTGLAKVYDIQGNTGKAEQTYRRSIELKPDYWEGYKDLGEHYLNRGKYPLAIEYLSKVVDLTPKNGSAYSNVGVAYYYDDQIDNARQMFENSLALDRDPLTANNLASIYFLEEKYELAAKMYEIALETFSNHYVIWGNLAAAYELTGLNEKAHDTYVTAIEKAHSHLEVNPNDPEVLADIGAYFSDIEDSTNALKYIVKALKLNAENIEVRKRAVSTYEQLGMREEAINWIDENMISYIDSQPELKALANDSRYLDIKKKYSEKISH